MSPEKITGMVLSSQNIGETDRRIVLLTREKGKISAFAKGAVKPRNPLVTATRPFTYGEFFLYAGRESYTVTGADVKNHFDGLVKDLDTYYYASYLSEIADYYTRENLDASDILLLLYQSLRALEKQTIGNELVRYIYEWRMLMLNGEVPDVFRCVRCGWSAGDTVSSHGTDGGDSDSNGKDKDNEQDTKRLAYFSSREHGMVCEKCATAEEYRNKLHHGTVYTLQYIVATPLERLYTFTVKDEILAEIKQLTDDYLTKTRQYKFNSLSFIETDAFDI